MPMYRRLLLTDTLFSMTISILINIKCYTGQKLLKDLKLPMFWLLAKAFFRGNKKYGEVTSLFKIPIVAKETRIN